MASPLSSKLDWPAANPIWAAALNPMIANPTNNISIIQNISLITGTNIINHKLGHMMIGWFLTDMQSNASVYRSAPFNSLTLTLTASAPIVVNIGVF